MTDHEVLAELRRLVPHLAFDRTAGGAWEPASAYLRPDGPLAELLGPDRTGRWVRDRRVAGSCWFFGLAMRVLGVGVGTWLLSGRLPAVEADVVSIQLASDLPARLAAPVPTLVGVGDRPPGGGPPPEDERALLHWFADQAFTRHLDPALQAGKEVVRVGADLQWGNAAAAAGSAGLSVERALAAEGRSPVASLEVFLDALPHGVGRRGWVDRAADGTTFWSRRACCLWYVEDPAGQRCGACSLRSPEERRVVVAASGP